MGVSSAGNALLDTSVLIALTQEGRDIDLGAYDTLVLSSVSYAELRLGVACARSAHEAISRAAALDQITSLFGAGLPFDDNAAREYGMILHTVVSRGGQPKAHVNDRMIASVAASRSLPLLTLNGADLAGLESHLRVVEL